MSYWGVIDEAPPRKGRDNNRALPMLPDLRARDEALAANGGQPLGDLTNALDFSQ